MDLGKAVRAGWGWKENPAAQRWMGVLLVVQVLLMMGAAIALVQQFGLQVLAILTDESVATDLLASQAAIDRFAATMGIWSIVSVLVAAYIGARLRMEALRQEKIKPAEFSWMKFVRLIGVGLAGGLAAVFSVFDWKWLGLAVAAVVGLVLAVASVPNVMASIGWGALSVLTALAYSGVIVRNSIRLSFAESIFLHYQKKGIVETLKASWQETEGKTWDLLVAYLVMGVGVGLAGAVVQAVADALAGSVAGDIVWSTILSGMLPLVVAPFLTAVAIYYTVNVYAQVRK